MSNKWRKWVGQDISPAYVTELEAELAELRLDYISAVGQTQDALEQLAELKCDMVKRERYHKAELVRLRNRLKMEMAWHSAGGSFDRVTAIKEVLEVK